MSRERHQAAGPTDNSALLDLSIWLMISMYLYVDTISGVLIGIMGGQAPLSQVWKGGILFLILLVSVKRSLTTILLSGASAVMLLVGPFYRLLATPNASGFGFESATALKALMPLVILLWCMDQQTARHRLIEIWPLRALWSAVLAVILNMMLGLAGLGNSTYGTGEHGIGIIGFFYAGNELGAVFTALSGFVLMWTWCRRRKIYVLVAGVVALIGVLIATKAAMLSAVMLALMVPAANQRGQWGKMPAGVAISLFILLVALAITMARVWFILEAAGLADRLQYAYSRRGWTGILFFGAGQLSG
ncbi:O-antigen ligase family protein [Pedomonas mirosovicensis]|uniref:O-antigen ligase family protein n=1 Tax=Pedomonas mirosovicensis TaxID=2908641 RepID=UPI0021672F38|nr:O-antigen ligase family protein [Pedomonas mirosovicensis]MCH8684178.1 O-antigen ligase family protein [Pedomonas mirosovicensis]